MPQFISIINQSLKCTTANNKKQSGKLLPLHLTSGILLI